MQFGGSGFFRFWHNVPLTRLHMLRYFVRLAQRGAGELIAVGEAASAHGGVTGMTAHLPMSSATKGSESGAELFVSDTIDGPERLGAFEEFIYGDSCGFLGQSRLVELSASNENFNKYERFPGDQIHASRLLTSGYAARALDGPDSDPHDNLFLSSCVSGEGRLQTEHNSERIFSGDLYINLSRNYRLSFDAGEYTRVVFPKKLIHGLDPSLDKFLILRRDDPATDILRSAAESVEAGIRSGDKTQAALVSELMISVAQRVLEHALAGPDDCGHNHLRDRAIEYIRDNLHRADLSVAEIADYIHVSRATLYRAFENVGGLKNFVVSERVQKAKTILGMGRTDRGFVAVVAYGTGFTTPEQFSRVFKTRTGLSPTQFVKGGTV